MWPTLLHPPHVSTFQALNQQELNSRHFRQKSLQMFRFQNCFSLKPATPPTSSAMLQLIQIPDDPIGWSWRMSVLFVDQHHHRDQSHYRPFSVASISRHNDSHPLHLIIPILFTNHQPSEICFNVITLWHCDSSFVLSPQTNVHIYISNQCKSTS